MPAAPLAVAVDTIVLERASLEDAVLATGELRADEAVELRAEESGRVVDLHFDEGERVEAGALLVEIQDADLRAELRRAQVREELAARREERARSLLDESTISEEVYDEAMNALKVARADVSLIEARLAKMRIHAPFSGVIGLRSVSVGSYVTSQTPIASLQKLDPVKLDFSVPERHAGAVAPGDRVEFQVTGSEAVFVGQVFAVEPRIDSSTRTLRVRARAPNTDGALLPGAFAEVRLVLDRRDDALLVPSIALVPGLEATTVYVVEDGVAQPRRVTIGRRTDERVEIVAGLAAGDQVIVRGVQQMRPGVPVRAAGDSGAAS
ncbi:MAG: efflux RND transporter periplasmic adaptor subunit [Acidobacteriota bacterium]